MIEGIDHVQLAIPPGGEEQARAFYVEVLGMREIDKPEPLASRGGAWFLSGGAHLHLGVDQDFKPATKAHPAFLVDDLAAVTRAIEGAGGSVTADASLAGVRRAYTHDPFGNRIELMQAGDGFSER